MAATETTSTTTTMTTTTTTITTTTAAPTTTLQPEPVTNASLETPINGDVHKNDAPLAMNFMDSMDEGASYMQPFFIPPNLASDGSYLPNGMNINGEYTDQMNGNWTEHSWATNKKRPMNKQRKTTMNQSINQLIQLKKPL